MAQEVLGLPTRESQENMHSQLPPAFNLLHRVMHQHSPSKASNPSLWRQGGGFEKKNSEGKLLLLKRTKWNGMENFRGQRIKSIKLGD